MTSHDSQCRSCPSCASGNEVGDLKGPLSAPLKSLPIDPRRSDFSQESLKPRPLQTHATFSGPIRLTKPDVAQSPAANALRSLSRSRTACSISDANSRRRLSETLSSALGGLRPRLLDLKRKRSKSSLLPATITVRKASVAVGLKGADDVVGVDNHQIDPCLDSPPSQPETPSSELVAFRSTMLGVADRGILPPTPSLEEQASTTRVLSGSQVKGVQEGYQSFLLGEGLGKRPRSTTAGTAITLANVCVAPGTFSVDPKSRRSSMASRGSPRRLSVIQFRSRNSVHEIIWSEDETTSESGSCKTISLESAETLPSVHSVMRGIQTTPPERSRTAPFRHNGRPGIDSGSSFGIDENLFHWSREGLSSASKDGSEPGNLARLVKSDDSPQQYVGKWRSSFAVDRKDRRSSASARSSIQSFPPLRERRSTAEWRQKPLVDLNDGTAGRAQERHVQADSELDRQGADTQAAVMEWADTQRGRKARRLSTHPYAQARIANDGKMGSSIGSCSHQRMNLSRLSA